MTFDRKYGLGNWRRALSPTGMAGGAACPRGNWSMAIGRGRISWSFSTTWSESEEMPVPSCMCPGSRDGRPRRAARGRRPSRGAVAARLGEAPQGHRRHKAWRGCRRVGRGHGSDSPRAAAGPAQPRRASRGRGGPNQIQESGTTARKLKPLQVPQGRDMRGVPWQQARKAARGPCEGPP